MYDCPRKSFFLKIYIYIFFSVVKLGFVRLCVIYTSGGPFLCTQFGIIYGGPFSCDHIGIVFHVSFSCIRTIFISVCCFSCINVCVFVEKLDDCAGCCTT